MTIKIRRAFLGDEKILVELNAFVQKFHIIHNPLYFKQIICRKSCHDFMKGDFYN
jgi:hypothetical protein